MQITDYTFANITARPFLTLDEINNKWTFTENTKHLVWNCSQGYLPPLPEMEKLLKNLK